MKGVKQQNSALGLSWDVLNNEGSLKRVLEEGLECPVCWEGFNNAGNLPYVLWCGHSLCKGCVMGLQCAIVKLPVVPVQLPFFISCPWCQFLSCRFVWKGKIKYPCKNFFLLWMVESVKGDIRQCHGSRVEYNPSLGAAVSVSRHPDFEYQGSRHSHGSAYPHSTRQFTPFSNSDIRSRPTPDVCFLHRLFNIILGLCTQLMAKFTLLVLALFIVFYVLPFSTIILVAYSVVTLFFAFPSFLVVYFAFPSLGWLLREIVT